MPEQPPWPGSGHWRTIGCSRWRSAWCRARDGRRRRTGAALPSGRGLSGSHPRGRLRPGIRPRVAMNQARGASRTGVARPWRTRSDVGRLAADSSFDRVEKAGAADRLGRQRRLIRGVQVVEPAPGVRPAGRLDRAPALEPSRASVAMAEASSRISFRPYRRRRRPPAQAASATLARPGGGPNACSRISVQEGRIAVEPRAWAAAAGQPSGPLTPPPAPFPSPRAPPAPRPGRVRAPQGHVGLPSKRRRYAPWGVGTGRPAAPRRPPLHAEERPAPNPPNPPK